MVAINHQVAPVEPAAAAAPAEGAGKVPSNEVWTTPITFLAAGGNLPVEWQTLSFDAQINNLPIKRQQDPDIAVVLPEARAATPKRE